MADRRVKVIFSAEIQNFKRAMEEAAQATKKTQQASEDSSNAADGYLANLVRSAHKNREAWELSGAALLGFGTAAVGGLALAGKAAMDWESAWAGVTKTVDGTPAQMDELEGSLRNLAKTLPSTHEEIAAVAEAAGQLGVKREDVVGFTKTMVDLGETTNLSADEAATSIAQISNVMGTMEREGSKGVERFGATLVALGNAGASTEAEILEMAKRIAGAAKLVGASESDVLALSNAMASLGIEAQLGGGVISRVMQRMYGDVKAGGEGLDRLAEVAGVSAKEFATAFETDPVRAVDMMVKGFGRIKDEGGNVIDTMSDLGIKGTEETGVILRLAGAGDILTDSLKLGDSAWQSNSALAEEAAKRYETTESKVKVAWNNIKDAAIEAGAVLLPVIAGIAEGAAGLAQTFGALPEPVKGVLTVLGSVAGVAALGAGAFLTLTPKILDSVQAFTTLNTRADGSSRGLGKVAKNAGIATAGILALTAAASIGNKIFGKAEVSSAQFAQGLLSVGENTEKLDALFKDGGLGTSIDGVGDAIKRMSEKSMFDEFSIWLGDVSTSGSKLNTLRDNLAGVDGALSGLVAEGKGEEAAKGFQAIKNAAEEQGVPLEKLVDMFPQYRDKLLEAKNAAGETNVTQDDLSKSMLEGGKATDVAAEALKAAAEASEEVQKALEDVGLAADGSVTDIDKFAASLFAAGLIHLSASDASIAYQAAIDAMTESVIKNGTTLDINTEQGRANQAAFNGIASSAMTAAEATAAETLATQGSAAAQAQLQASLRTSYDDLVRAAGQLGITGDEADTMARKALGIPKEVPIDTWVNDNATAKLDALKTKADNLDGKQVKITTVEHNIKILETQVRGGNAGLGDDVSLTALDPGRATGGRIPGLDLTRATGGRIPSLAEVGYAAGGKLPTTGPGTDTTDGFLGISSAGVPLARVDAGEWIINGRSSDRYNRELAAINAGTFPKMPGYANGGQPSREYSARELGYSPAASSAGSPSAIPDIYVENPFTGEYLLAKVDHRAAAAVTRFDANSPYMRPGRTR
ncbi:phage tail tape measure protein [Pseudarthrobacter sp. CCNWLW207]|uniref:phage tail tape measure protein n=1 Tax=Pseudarthrobacter sp. CCNWLW207 TaxID=3127468 RepID=UPI003076D55D